MLRSVALLVAAVSAACSVGTRVARFQPALRPEGVIATLHLASGPVEAEVLAIDDTALIVRRLQDSLPVAVVRFKAIRDGTFHQVSAVISAGRPPRAVDRERIRLVSRFPQGLTPELLQSLLAAYGQAQPHLF
jgi:hypothetical protein